MKHRDPLVVIIATLVLVIIATLVLVIMFGRDDSRSPECRLAQTEMEDILRAQEAGALYRSGITSNYIADTRARLDIHCP